MTINIKNLFPFDKVVEVILKGGLGNQLFQVSAALFMAKQLNRKVLLNIVAIDSTSDITRRFQLDNLDLSCLFDLSFTNLGFKRRNKINRIREKLRVVGSFIAIDDKNFATIFFTESKIDNNKDVLMNGWFQDTNIVSNVILDGASCKILKRSKSLKETCDLIANLQSPIILHMRFGDFVDNNLDILSPEYYVGAINEFREKNNAGTVVCFSDELIVAKSMLQGVERVIFPEDLNVLSAPELLYVFSQSEFFVSSKSTLAWWGACLATMNGGKVITPWDGDLLLPK